jgi:tetrapyrrole methylase family protein / MazG family protein
MADRPVPKADDRTITQPTEAERRSFGDAFERLVGLMARLRGDNGCAWDAAQDLRTLRPYLLEEAYEVLDAIERGTPADHQEELGDLLLQVVFQAEVRRQEGAFDVADVAHGIADKLVRRHPHVFGDAAAKDPGEAYLRWEEIKAKEKAGRSVLGGVPKELPALLRAQRVRDKASGVGFDWHDVEGALTKLEEEIGELKDAVRSKDKGAIEKELGDALFSLVNVASFTEVDAEASLRETIARFSRRFAHIERTMKARGRALKSCTLEELDLVWREAKKLEAAGTLPDYDA